MSRLAVIATGALSGAWLGSKIGIAAGPWGAIAGTIPGFLAGGYLADSEYRRWNTTG